MKCSSQAISFLECLAAMLYQLKKRKMQTMISRICNIILRHGWKNWTELVSLQQLYLPSFPSYGAFSMKRISMQETYIAHKRRDDTSYSIEWLSRNVMLHGWSTVLAAVADMECDHSDDLLEEIAEKWISVRSHSFASRCMVPSSKKLCANWRATANYVGMVVA